MWAFYPLILLRVVTWKLEALGPGLCTLLVPLVSHMFTDLSRTQTLAPEVLHPAWYLSRQWVGAESIFAQVPQPPDSCFRGTQRGPHLASLVGESVFRP